MRIDELRLGGAVLMGVTAVVSPLAALVGDADPPVGVISACIFPGCLVTIDYPERRIVIRKGEIEMADGNRTFGYETSDCRPVVPIHIAGRSIPVLVDTGYSEGLKLDSRLLAELPVAGPPSRTGSVRGAAGEIPLLTASIVAPITLSAHTLLLDSVLFEERDGRRANGAEGFIGSFALRRFVVTLDSRNWRIRFETSAATPARAG